MSRREDWDDMVIRMLGVTEISPSLSKKIDRVRFLVDRIDAGTPLPTFPVAVMLVLLDADVKTCGNEAASAKPK